ncbi:MAG TPA: hypothetical protein VN808_16955 [Stellaceae bacterium]|nr:hypothetical protein [Stellaceae bacterium]
MEKAGIRIAATGRVASPSENSGTPSSDQGQFDEPPAPNQAALARWAQAHALLRDKTLSGGVRPQIQEPGGKRYCPTADEWRQQGAFPAPDEAEAHWPSRGGFPLHIVYLAELRNAFDSNAERRTSDEKPERRRQSPTRDRVRDAMLCDLKSGDPRRDPRLMKQSALPGWYGVKSRETCTKALHAAVSLFAGRQSATNDK